MTNSNKISSIRYVALTAAGKALAERLCLLLEEGEVWYKPSPFAEKIQSAFVNGEALVFICATGIVVRTLAPVLNNKYEDPPVLVIDEQGRFVIPLLSGHEGGANEWARQVSELLSAQLVQTTAASYHNPVYTVGMGCERNCPLDDLRSLLFDCLQQSGLSLEQIHSIHSIDIKADEVALLALAVELNIPFRTWSVSDLSSVEHLLSQKSDYVFKTVGVYGVAESAALVGAQNSMANAIDKSQQAPLPELMLTKQKNAKATCAIARIYPV